MSRSWARAAGFVALSALGLAGCRGNEPQDFSRYVPNPATARTAVEAALHAWQEGQPVGPVRSPGVETRVVDSHRKPGQRLTRFEILGPTPADRARGFVVKLTLADPDDSTVARFLVVGADPLWVFRQEDYEMISHWMHAMGEAPEKAP